MKERVEFSLHLVVIEMGKMKKYRTKCWIEVEQEEDVLMNKKEAEEELEHLQTLHPDNRYEIEEVD